MTVPIKYEIKCTGIIFGFPYEVLRNGDLIHCARTRQEAVDYAKNYVREEQLQKKVIV